MEESLCPLFWPLHASYILTYIILFSGTYLTFVKWEKNISPGSKMTLINLAVLTAISPVWKTFLFWHRKCSSYKWKRKKKSLQNKKTVFTSKKKKQGESQEIQGHQNYWKKQDFLSHFLINKPEWSLKV